MDQDSEGVMDGDYAFDRHSKLELKYRYKVRARVAADAIRKYADGSKKPRVLDFGAADGRTLLELRELLGAGSFTGIEYSTELIQYAKNLPADTQIIHGDVTDLPEYVKSQTFDVVIALAILEHLPNPVKAVCQAKDVLSPGGIFVASSPNPTWDKISGVLKNGLSEHHVSRMDKSNMIRVVKNAGLELVTYEQFMWAPLSFLPYLRIWVEPGFAVRADNFLRGLRIFNWLFVNSCVIGRKLTMEIRV